MRIAYVIPGPMSKGPMGSSEIRRREKLLNSWAFDGTTVEAMDVESGPTSIESAYEEALCVPATLDLLMDCEDKGFDAAIIGCFGDPGLEPARELCTMPIIGPCEASLLLAASLGHKFSVLTLFDSLIANQEHLVSRVGVREKLASVRASNTPVLGLMSDRDATKTRLMNVATSCIEEDRADVVVLGCMTMAFLGINEEISTSLGVPCVNAAKAALKQAETLVSLGLGHSKTAFATPPKVTRGQSVADLKVG